MSEEREKAATPTLESMENSFEALLNDSNLSECDGDMEVFPREGNNNKYTNIYYFFISLINMKAPI